MLLASLLTLLFPLLPLLTPSDVHLKLFYGFTDVSILCLTPAGNSLMPVGVMKTFGAEYYGAIMGMMYTAYVSKSLARPNLL